MKPYRTLMPAEVANLKPCADWPFEESWRAAWLAWQEGEEWRAMFGLWSVEQIQFVADSVVHGDTPLKNVPTHWLEDRLFPEQIAASRPQAIPAGELR